MKLFLNRIHFPVSALGPGRRVGIWFQGCSIRCPGCISRDTWEPGRGEIELADALRSLQPWLRQADGVTITGGEPFDQREALRALLQAIRAESAGDVLIFSGYEFDALPERFPEVVSEELADAIVSGPFVSSAGQTLPLRGSDNQELHLLTELGRSRFAVLDPERRLDVFEDENGLWFAGIPYLEDWATLQRQLAAGGVTGSFSHQSPRC